VAWDNGRSNWRTFRVDRITSGLKSGPRFQPREPPEDVAAYVARSIASTPQRYRARLKLKGSVETLAKKIPPWVGVLETIDERHCSLSVGGDSVESLVAHMVLSGLDFELLEPADLRGRLRQFARRLEQAAGAATPAAKRG